MDIVNELRKSAAPATMVRSAQDDYKTQNDAERRAKDADLMARRLDEQARHNQATEENRANQTIAMMSRGSGGSGAREGESKFTSAINSAQRNLSVTEEKTAKRFREPTPQEKINPEKNQAYQNEKNSFIDGNAEVKAQRERVAALRDKEARELLGGGSSKDKPVMQPVRVNGKEIGQASTPEEAQALVAKWKASQKK